MVMDARFSQNVRSSPDTGPPTACRIIDTGIEAQPEMSSLSIEVFQQFYSKLVEALPMDDPNFTANLYSARLLPSYLKEYVESRSPATRTEKATRFLDQVIKPSMTSFNGLLNVMEDSEYQHVKELAKQIRMNTLKKISTTYSGM